MLARGDCLAIKRRVGEKLGLPDDRPAQFGEQVIEMNDLVDGVRGPRLLTIAERRVRDPDFVGPGLCEQLVIHLESRKILAAFPGFGLLAHAGPDIGIDGVRATDRGQRIVSELDLGAGGRGNSERRRGDLRMRSVAFGGGNREFCAQAGCSQHQRVCHVVAITDISKVQLAHVPKFFLKGEEVGKGLAGMLHVAQSIDDWNAGVLCDLGHRFMLEGAHHHRIHPAFNVVGDIAQGFAVLHAGASLVHKESGAAQAGHQGSVWNEGIAEDLLPDVRQGRRGHVPVFPEHVTAPGDLRPMKAQNSL